MASFQRLLERMSRYAEASDSKSAEAIRTGINIRPEFWDDFLLVINNSDAMSELLDVPALKISTWHGKVREVLEKVKAQDAVPDPKKKGKLLHNSDEDPFDKPEGSDAI